jgi:tetratricopeptide (TPR) repeat protein
MRHASWILLVIVLAGCQGQSAKPPAAAATVSSFAPEPIPPEVAAPLEEGDLVAALAKIDQMIAERPSDATLHSIRSTIHQRQGNDAAAVADLNKAVELNGQDPRLFNNRGYVLLGMQQLTAALADFDRATELAPEYTNPFNNRGLLLIAKGQYASAIEQLDQALRLDPNYVDACNNRGFAAFQAGNVEAALTDFNRALSLNPKYVNAYNNRALLRARVGDLDNAIDDLTKAMMLDPLNPKYYEHRCEIFRRMHEGELALADESRHDWLLKLQDLGAEIRANPKDVQPLIARAEHHLAADDAAKAMEDVQRALKLEPESLSSLLLRGRIRLRMSDFQNALADANAALAIDPRQEAYSLRGDACLGLKDYDGAIESFAKARRIDAPVAEAYFRKSQILQASGEEGAAKDFLERAVALNPSINGSVPPPEETGLGQENDETIAALLERGRQALDMGDFQSALSDANAALKIEPRPEAFSLRGDAFLALKDYDRAIDSLTKARRIDSSLADAYFRKSQLQRAAGQDDEADENLERAVALNPSLGGSTKDSADGARAEKIEESIAALLKRGRSSLDKGDFAAALGDANAALKLDPRQEAYSLKGDACLRLKDYDKAIESFAKARRIDAPVAEAYYRKSQALRVAGKTDAAADSLKQALALDPDVAVRLR